MASFIIHKPRERSHFTKAALKTVSVFVKAWKEQIDVLITDEEVNSKGWLGIRADNANADTIAHKHGVVLVLSEKLHSVTSQFDQLRAVRFQDAINRAMPRRKPKCPPPPPPPPPPPAPP
ncbi:hypothetical protein HanRHA438_Chr16g0784421 [Helianthus annuus]|nr:hypothetical protein HanRHA438_Chr16g0784421 [Helianthus annuus]